MSIDRRTFIAASGAAAGCFLSTPGVSAMLLSTGFGSRTETSPAPGIRYCLNTSTIREQNVGIEREIDIAAKAGYSGIEPWMRQLTEYVDRGGQLSDLRKRLDDHGLTVESAIGFAEWIVDDDERRRDGLETARRDMDLLSRIGGLRIAAPPVGAHAPGPKLDLFKVAERYRELLRIGESTGVIPQLEVWGFSSNLSRLGESVAACVEAAHPDACLLPDVYHIYRGGSKFEGLSLLDDNAIHVFHMNDYPETSDRKELTDADRVYPGDGVAPLSDILKMIGSNGRSVALSLELFNPEYWKQDAQEVASTGLKKMQDAVAAAGLA